jgi:competence protein ComEC
VVKKIFQRISNPFVAASVLFALLAYSGAVTPGNRRPYKSAVPFEKARKISGVISSNPQKTSSGKFYRVKIDVSSSAGEISRHMVSSSSSGRITSMIPSEIVESLYPGKISVSSGGILVEQGAAVEIFGSVRNSVFFAEKVSAGEAKKTVRFKIASFRGKCRLRFKRLMFSWGRAGGFILALLAGERGYTDDFTAENFRNAGLSHVLALSGMHLSFFSSFSSRAGKKFFGKKYDCLLKFLGILFFAWFAGFSPSLFRAFCFSLISLLCSAVFCAKIDSFSVLCAVFLFHASAVPEDVFSVSFMLSYLALGGIMLFSEFLAIFLSRIFPFSVSNAVSASAAANFSTAPVSLHFFGSISSAAIVSSSVVSPLVSGFLTAAVWLIAFSLAIPWISVAAGGFLNAFCSLIFFLAEFFARFPQIRI